MNNIQLLDCTLRDGGYVNNWHFKTKNIVSIIKDLSDAKLEFIECGYFKLTDYNPDKSVFSKISQLEKLYNVSEHTRLTLMINYGEYPIEDIEECKNKHIMLRIAFKKFQFDEAMIYCKQLKDLGYSIFINPMYTDTYSKKEVSRLVEKVNEIEPFALTIVDTSGSMKEKDVLSYYRLINHCLNPNIALCFHSHNNLQLSFSNAQSLLKKCKNRKLIIDSTVFGMGRGAGNLCTELMTKYINDNYDGKYDILPILSMIDEQINPIFAKTPWGYSVPYYISGINHCHPNYAKFFKNKQTVHTEIINKVLQKIPDKKKTVYDKKLIEKLYIEACSKN